MPRSTVDEGRWWAPQQDCRPLRNVKNFAGAKRVSVILCVRLRAVEDVGPYGYIKDFAGTKGYSVGGFVWLREAGCLPYV